MFRITPLGTCRIHTPLARAARRYPIELDLRRNYGFVHTSAEALQLVRFLQSDKAFRSEVLPLVFRPGDIGVVDQQPWEPSDLHIVEVSSAKKILSGEDVVQINYVYRHFADFFSSTERARQFWNLSRAGHRGDLLDFLGQQRSYQLLREAERALLASLTTDQQTFKAIKADMAEIVDRLGRDRVLFVTHVNALGSDGEVLRTRDRLVRWVRIAAEQLGAGVFDPTPTMLDFGQESALEAGGRDLTHYTAAFSDQLYDVLHQEHVLPLLGSGAAESSADSAYLALARTAARLEAVLESGDFFAASREIHGLVDEHPHSVDLLQLRGMVRASIGDNRGAVADLRTGGDDLLLSQAARIALLRALTNVGLPDEALEIAEGLIRDEVQNSDVYLLASVAAEGSGHLDQAVDHAKQAYRLNRPNLAIALRALHLMADMPAREQEAAEFRGEILENMGPAASGAFELCIWAIRHRDEELFEAALKAIASSDKWSTIDLLEDALAADLPGAIAASIPIAVGLGRLSPALEARRVAILAAALEKAHALAAEGRPAEAYRIAAEIDSLTPAVGRQMVGAELVNDARQLGRTLKQELRSALADAHAGGDPQRVVDVGIGAGDFLREDGRSAALVARALHTLGHPKSGLLLLKAVDASEQDEFVVKRWTARIAAGAQDYGTALAMYGSLRDSTGPEVERLMPEIDRFFASVEGRSLKQLRALALAGNLEEGLQLARNITRYIGPLERTQRELMRLYGLLRGRLRQIEEGEVGVEEREGVFRRMLEIKPQDLASWKRLAVELMRQSRYAEAAECWAKLRELDPSKQTAEQNRVRCVTLAQRRTSASPQVIEAMG
jgi:tetratricopeptide (TPR) repeat protein